MSQHRRAIAVIIRNDSGEILLSQRGESARSEIGFWENVGGEIDPNEDIMDAVKREVMEELGVELDIQQLLFSDEFPPDSNDVVWSTHVFEGRIHGKPQIKEPEKCSAIQWISLDRLNRFPLASYTRSDFVRLGWIKE